MATIVWSDDYSVNVAGIDEQPKTLIGLVNDLHTAAESRVHRARLNEKLAHLVAFSRRHLATEEEPMQEHGYPRTKGHRREHRASMKHLSELETALSSGQDQVFFPADGRT